MGQFAVIYRKNVAIMTMWLAIKILTAMPEIRWQMKLEKKCNEI